MVLPRCKMAAPMARYPFTIRSMTIIRLVPQDTLEVIGITLQLLRRPSRMEAHRVRRFMEPEMDTSHPIMTMTHPKGQLLVCLSIKIVQSLSMGLQCNLHSDTFFPTYFRIVNTFIAIDSLSIVQVLKKKNRRMNECDKVCSQIDPYSR